MLSCRALSAENAPSGIQWQRTPAPGVAFRFIADLEYHEAVGAFVLFGGAIGHGQEIGDTWLFDGETWTQVESREAPAARYGHAMAYVPQRGEVILFGGGTHAGELFGDTWAFDGARWRLIEGEGPGERRSAAMASNPATGELLLFGGRGPEDPGFRNDTWVRDRDGWRLVSEGGPPARYGASVVYAPSMGTFLLFGGNDHSERLFNTLWAWRGDHWEALPTEGDLPEGGGQMVSDAAGEVVLLLGHIEERSRRPAFYALDGLRWTLIDDQTTLSATGDMFGFDPVRRLLIVVEGVGGEQPGVNVWTGALTP